MECRADPVLGRFRGRWGCGQRCRRYPLRFDLRLTRQREEETGYREWEAGQVDRGRDQNPEVRPDAPVRDIVQVVPELAADALNVRVRWELGLGQSGQPGPDGEPVAVPREGRLEDGDKLGPL